MLIDDETFTRLALEHGIELSDPSSPDADIALLVPGWPAANEYKVKVFPTRLTPSALRNVLGRNSPGPPTRLLLVVPSASKAFIDGARRDGVSVMIRPPDGRTPARSGYLIGDGGRILALESAPEPDAQPTRRPGPVPWSTFAVAFECSESGPRTQTQIAHKLGISQGGVSKAMHNISATRLTNVLTTFPKGAAQGDRNVEKDQLARLHNRHSPARVETLLNWLAASYPRSPRATTTWLTRENPNDTARSASALLAQRGIRHAVSGQVAADKLAPWARPQRALIWAEKLTDMSEASATPVPAQDANLILAVPEDPHLLRTIDDEQQPPILPPVRVWLDLIRDGDDQAADALKAHLLKWRSA
ncbi:hypothetical protein [Occultella kanbiaonis]|uniref:hypothetical protein n=1 Tax=Occultella kanbiaonis TaxID=2675754 RepID=UPI0013D61845|nr:hypothetical protein [Occultella kanbiaonis]